jgi:hypothetical protein
MSAAAERLASWPPSRQYTRRLAPLHLRQSLLPLCAAPAHTPSIPCGPATLCRAVWTCGERLRKALTLPDDILQVLPTDRPPHLPPLTPPVVPLSHSSPARTHSSRGSSPEPVLVELAADASGVLGVLPGLPGWGGGAGAAHRGRAADGAGARRPAGRGCSATGAEQTPRLARTLSGAPQAVRASLHECVSAACGDTVQAAARVTSPRPHSPNAVAPHRGRP